MSGGKIYYVDYGGAGIVMGKDTIEHAMVDRGSKDYTQVKAGTSFQ